MDKQDILVMQVIDQIRRDLDNLDTDALTELLNRVPTEVLEAFLPESGNDGQPDEAQEWHDFDPEC